MSIFCYHKIVVFFLSKLVPFILLSTLPYVVDKFRFYNVVILNTYAFENDDHNEFSKCIHHIP